ncbi:MAG: TIGR00730 family Rossman fold protein [candidate division KSB1 bacterium]|nr:TIGR00730 family Rossman fold protein [candidate division KSB1 bacterium]MDZ7386594.1 TIGR00730 family Rossman fold protein [candidate division KSB1 bacterium]MDZ7391706.1 TIGR00730 family Rossman fold protein [candidate division KSB1 bacterium]MDZ7413953.1 TIGR00730 family Rossman fold protein [candidate division KSB1 bacterium]
MDHFQPVKAMIQRVCVFCASSSKIDECYLRPAFALGQIFAREGITLIYGGGAVGLMGAVADGALSRGGRVVGVIPHFMVEREWAHKGVQELIVVHTMNERKERMRALAQALVALPGGSGTLEELLEAISLKRLGMYLGPIVLLNTQGFFDHLLQLLERCIAERFMDPRHRQMWAVVKEPEEVLDAIRNSPPWQTCAVQFAAL